MFRYPTFPEHTSSVMLLPYVHESFPKLLQPVGSVSDEVLEATRAVRWQERAERISDDVKCWSECEGVQESDCRDGGRSNYLHCPPRRDH